MLAGSTWRSTSPFTHERIGAAAVYCSDGRYNEQFDEFLHGALGLPRYDRLVLPGGAACLAGYIESWRDEESLADQLRFLISAHGLARIVLIAHEGCGFYLKRLGIQTDNLRARQAADLAKASDRILAIDAGVKVEAYWASIQNGCVAIEGVALGEA